MYEYHYSPLKQNTERFPTVSYLSGTIVAVTAVILAKKVDRNSFQRACQAFKKAIHLLEDIAPGFSLGRRLLRRFHNVIQAATQTMLKGQANTNDTLHPPNLGRIDLGPVRHDPLPSYNHALFDLELEDLVHFENLPMLEDDQAMSLLNPTNMAMGPYPVATTPMPDNTNRP